MKMPRSAARRLWVYSLLLLLPALAVGGLSLALLKREQSRLAERELAASESRRAAVETRARLIAENIELLVGDVQSTLMDTLRAAPDAEPRPFLTEWQATNPLVSDVFRATAEGRLVWGATSTPLRAWIAQGGSWGRDTAPALDAPASPAPARLADAGGVTSARSALGSTRAKDESKEASSQPSALTDARRDITSNVSQYQRARQEIQAVAKVKNYADVAAKSAVSLPQPSAEKSFDAGSSVAYAPAPAAFALSADKTIVAVGNDEAARGVADSFAETSGGVSPPLWVAETASAAKRESRAKVVASPASSNMRSGWSPWRDAEGLHLFGWRELPDRTVVGVELRLDAIRARLGEVFPAQPSPDEAYELRDMTGRAWHTVGGVALPIALEVPLAAATLPGWTVVGHALAAEDGSAPVGSFFALGATLIGLLVLAILAAGALLLRQARLSEAEAALKTSFVANVSHELKTPLTTIRLYAELLAQGRVREPAKQADYLATIGRETQRLARLVGNVLDFSRLEAGKKNYDCTTFDIVAELRRLAGTHGPRLAEAGLELQVELPATQDVSTDRDALEQILLNLFDNACKYAANGGAITLRLEVERTRVQVVVGDRGPGVAAEQRERIFEKFHRVDDRLTAEKGGAGLGLSIARQLARGLAGDLCCRSRDGGGAEFVLTLPLTTLSA